MNARRAYLAIIAFYDLPPGGTVPIVIDGDQAGDALILHPDHVVADAITGLGLAKCVAEDEQDGFSLHEGRQCGRCRAVTGSQHIHRHELPDYQGDHDDHDLDGYDCLEVRR